MPDSRDLTAVAHLVTLLAEDELSVGDLAALTPAEHDAPCVSSSHEATLCYGQLGGTLGKTLFKALLTRAARAHPSQGGIDSVLVGVMCASGVLGRHLSACWLYVLATGPAKGAEH